MGSLFYLRSFKQGNKITLLLFAIYLRVFCATRELCVVRSKVESMATCRLDCEKENESTV